MANRLTAIIRRVFAPVAPVEVRRELGERAYIHPENDISMLYHNMLPEKQVVLEPFFDIEVKSLFQRATSGNLRRTWCLRIKHTAQDYVYEANDVSIEPAFTPQYGFKRKEVLTFFIGGNLTGQQMQHLKSVWEQRTSLDQFLDRVAQFTDVKEKNTGLLKRLLKDKLPSSEFYSLRREKLLSLSSEGQSDGPS